MAKEGRTVIGILTQEDRQIIGWIQVPTAGCDYVPVIACAATEGIHTPRIDEDIGAATTVDCVTAAVIRCPLGHTVINCPAKIKQVRVAELVGANQHLPINKEVCAVAARDVIITEAAEDGAVANLVWVQASSSGDDVLPGHPEDNIVPATAGDLVVTPLKRVGRRIPQNDIISEATVDDRSPVGSENDVVAGASGYLVEAASGQEDLVGRPALNDLVIVCPKHRDGRPVCATPCAWRCINKLVNVPCSARQQRNTTDVAL